MTNLPDVKHFVFKDTAFTNLMNRRILNVLLIATKYDAFMPEDDGRVDEQIFNEYTAAYPSKTSRPSTTSFAGWATPNCCSPSSNCPPASTS